MSMCWNARCGVIVGLLTTVVVMVSAETPIVFSSERFGGRWEICTMDPDTRVVRNLTNHPANDTSPSWSPDGKQVAFTSDRDGGVNIYLLDVKTGAVRRITDGGGNDAKWSPDGRRLIYRSGNNDIVTLDLKTMSEKTLAPDPAIEDYPEYSPRGDRIIFASKRDDDVWHIFLMDADGARIQRLTDSKEQEEQPTWSPSGERIAFVVTNSDGNTDIHIVDVEGAKRRVIAGSPSYEFQPSWNGDASKIVFVSHRLPSIDRDLYMVNMAGKVSQLTDQKGWDSEPRWYVPHPEHAGKLILSWALLRSGSR